jgi:hypothetical protein
METSTKLCSPENNMDLPSQSVHTIPSISSILAKIDNEATSPLQTSNAAKVLRSSFGGLSSNFSQHCGSYMMESSLYSTVASQIPEIHKPKPQRPSYSGYVMDSSNRLRDVKHYIPNLRLPNISFKEYKIDHIGPSSISRKPDELRRQEARFPGDLYTPLVVRSNKNKKEGLCRICSVDRWFCLKTSAYW